MVRENGKKRMGSELKAESEYGGLRALKMWHFL